VDGQTRLTVVPDEGAAEVVCGLLRSEGILCFHRPTDLGAEAAIAAVGQWKEIVVRVDDLLRARELLHEIEAALDECVRLDGRSATRVAGIATTWMSSNRTARSARTGSLGSV
jgi:hypothetical protein